MAYQIFDSPGPLNIGTVSQTGLTIGRAGQTFGLNSAAFTAATSGTSAWTNTAGNLTFSTVTTGDIQLSPIAALTLTGLAASTWRTNAASAHLTVSAAGATSNLVLSATLAATLDGATSSVGATSSTTTQIGRSGQTVTIPATTINLANVSAPAPAATLQALGIDTSSGQIGPVTAFGRDVIATTVTANGTTTSYGQFVPCDPSLGAFTVKLPVGAAASVGQKVIFKNITTSTNTITIQVNNTGTETIFSSASGTTTTISAAGGSVTCELMTSILWQVI